MGFISLINIIFKTSYLIWLYPKKEKNCDQSDVKIYYFKWNCVRDGWLRIKMGQINWFQPINMQINIHGGGQVTNTLQMLTVYV